MSIFRGIEKLITEDGSSVILRERIAIIRRESEAQRKQIATLEQEKTKLKKRVSELERELASAKQPSAPLPVLMLAGATWWTAYTNL